MSIDSYLRAIPKAELHVHVEGSVNLATLIELAERNGVDLPYETPEALANWFIFKDFPHFISVYRTIILSLRSVEDYESTVFSLGSDLARQNCRYAEATFSPSAHERSGVPATTWFDGITRGRDRVLDELGVELNWIFDIPRHAEGTVGDRRADYTLEMAIGGMSDGVVGLGLGGSEAGFAPDRWAPWFDRARAAGLHSAPHAGEHGGPESIWGAIHRLGAERIGHGARATEDPALVAHLAETKLPIEVNLTSNLQTGIFPSYQKHSFSDLFRAGCILTVNSDDPPIFQTTLNDEYLKLATELALSVESIEKIALDAVRSSFLPGERRVTMEADYRVEMESLRSSHLDS